MWVFPILVAAAAIYFGAHEVALAQATTPNIAPFQGLPTTPNVTPPFQGLSTPVTSTVTNCMMSCNSQAANCLTDCFIRTAPTTVSARGEGTLNATSNTACVMGCSSSRLACQTSCGGAWFRLRNRLQSAATPVIAPSAARRQVEKINPDLLPTRRSCAHCRHCPPCRRR